MKIHERKNDPIVSVVIPVFNAESTLSRCLESVADQTLIDKMEIILIDDGSEDASYEMCGRFASGHSNVRLIRQNQAGVAKARNVGIECALGKFIGFVDADDVVDRLMYEVLLANALDESAEISVIGFNIQFGNHWVRRYGTQDRMVLDRIQALYSFFGEYQIDASVCTKLFSHELCRNVMFNENLAYGEDRRFVFEALMIADRTVYDDRCLYNYYCNSDSAMHKPFNSSRFALLDNASSIRARACDAYPEVGDRAACYELRCYSKTYEELLMDKSAAKVFKEEKRNLRKYLASFDFCIAKKYMLKRHFYAALFLKWTPRLFCRLSRLIKR